MERLTYALPSLSPSPTRVVSLWPAMACEGEGSGTGSGAGAGNGDPSGGAKAAGSGGSGGGNGPGSGTPAAKAGADGKIMLTQAELDEIIETRLGRERRLLETKLSANPKDAEELARLREAEKERQRKEAEDKGNYERALQSLREDHTKAADSWRERETTLLKEIREDRCRGRLVTELSAQGAIDAEDLAEVLLTRVDLDDDRQVVVLGADRKPAFAGGKPVSIKDLVTKYKTDKPWAFKADNAGQGSGSGGGKGTSDEGEGDLTGIDAELKAAETELAEVRKKAVGEPVGGPNMTKARELRRKIQSLQDQKRKKGSKAA